MRMQKVTHSHNTNEKSIPQTGLHGLPSSNLPHVKKSPLVNAKNTQVKNLDRLSQLNSMAPPPPPPPAFVVKPSTQNSVPNVTNYYMANTQAAYQNNR